LSQLYGCDYLKKYLKNEVDLGNIFAKLVDCSQQHNLSRPALDLVVKTTLKIYDIYVYLYKKYQEFRSKNPNQVYILEKETNKWIRFNDFIDFLIDLCDPTRKISLRNQVLKEAKEKGFASTNKFVFKSSEDYLNLKLELIEFDEHYGVAVTAQAANAFLGFLKIQDELNTSNVHKMFHPIWPARLEKVLKLGIATDIEQDKPGSAATYHSGL
jgi:hypothetical protein